MPIDYQQGKIYTIRSPQTDEFYIGSTTQLLSKRFYGHKKNYASYQGGKFNYVTSFKILQHDDAYIELYELYPCTCKAELLRREGQLQRENKDNCVNKNIAGRTDREYREDNNDKIREHKKIFYEENKEKINIQKKKFYEENKDMILEKQKKYHQNNKDIINERRKQYRQANAERIKAYKTQKIECECGVTVNRDHLARHKRTVKHQKYIN
jgi:hypothetical protein